MKLEYSRPGKFGNYGDDLNEWFWDEIAPGLTDDDPSTVLLGMGTIFSRWYTDTLPAKSRKVLIGSGGGKAGGAPTLDDTWHVYGVRGPLTASYSGLPHDKILTDPAMLLRDLPAFKNLGPRKGIGFMPHIWSLDAWDWQKVAEDLGLIFINPRDEAKETTRRIGRLEGLITEAMHGAIVGDALRTPWVAVRIAPGFETSKWSDWAGSLNMAMHFHSLRDLHRQPAGSPVQTLKRVAKSTLQQVGVNVGSIARPASNRWEVEQVRKDLSKLIKNPPYQLSEDSSLNAALNRMRDALGLLQADKQKGIFA